MWLRTKKCHFQYHLYIFDLLLYANLFSFRVVSAVQKYFIPYKSLRKYFMNLENTHSIIFLFYVIIQKTESHSTLHSILNNYFFKVTYL